MRAVVGLGDFGRRFLMAFMPERPEGEKTLLRQYAHPELPGFAQ